ncbi:hybrid sensor histidine kinase/response regulator [Gillisia limnaea]|uniref:histidine kinase n=1 Tax=Gillisia limnaea (strain DSM 15749 / LMG 21470 / R-8282) TaxID=865937 RepID=H2BTB9_GILLR|nr:hybrid sensor histidine kinase/response regulator [Gillisia limnaea]EHQ03718.1 ATP-binding region ATPase domain protein [Gillisia limnaea DSM 15749]
MALYLPQPYSGAKLVMNYGSLLFLILFALQINAQNSYQAQPLSETISLHEYAVFANAGQQIYTLEEVRKNPKNLDFRPIGSENPNIGFTKDQYWVKFTMTNNTAENFTYYLETARPITDKVELFSIGTSGEIQRQQSGDKMAFSDRSFDHRKTIFELQLPSEETLEIYIHYENDGEVLNLPLNLHNASSLLKITYFEQLVFGIFFGILLIAAIIYLFFFFALGERSFLFYSFYVITVGLLQFSLDGYFNQYFEPGGGWFSNHSVVLFAIISGAFLGKYSEVYLNIKQSSSFLPKIFNGIYICLGLLLVAVVFVPEVPAFSYPTVNVLGLGVLVAILVSVILLFSKKIVVDKFFLIGIFFLILGFVIFILNNLSVLPNTFLTQNSAKLGTGLEIIFLSLSMANRIKKLKSEKEELQRLALIRLQEMNELKSYFLSNLSHELRTPLNAIMGLADSMAFEAENQKVKNTSNVIKASSVRLLNLINDILDFSKIEKGELNLEKEIFDPLEILKELQLSYKNQAEEKGLAFEHIIKNQVSGFVIGDANRLAQIVNNILDNAVKFTPEGKVQVYLETSIGQNETLELTLRVSDTGIGIPKDKMETIFESLTQESINNKRKYGGLGLGLYIIKVLVDMHHGMIHMESNQGSGTTCTLKLSYPLAPKPIVTEKQFPTDSYDLLGSKILVVEDDPINQMVLKMIFKKWKGTQFSFASNGAEGLEKLKEESFDLILMDLQMPVMDGYEACITIRKGDAGAKNKNIPIIAVTADVMESTKQRVIRIGMDDYLAKPVHKDRLYVKIIRLLEGAAMVKQ